MLVKLIHRKNGVYDAYNRASGKWLFTRTSPDNVFKELSKFRVLQLDFIDETIDLSKLNK